MPGKLIMLSPDEGFNIAESDLRLALQRAVPDREAHIRHARLNDSHDCGMHVSEIFDRVACHVHFSGDEVYEIICGYGVIYSGPVRVEGDQAEVRPVDSMEVFPGDVFKIPQGVAHQLVRKGEEPLIIIFACHDNHMGPDRRILPDICPEGRED
ncbi:MAG: hypothetical protein AB1403_03415 [Candidatus Riflebacteria bacterium]